MHVHWDIKCIWKLLGWVVFSPSFKQPMKVEHVEIRGLIWGINMRSERVRHGLLSANSKHYGMSRYALRISATEGWYVQTQPLPSDSPPLTFHFATVDENASSVFFNEYLKQNASFIFPLGVTMPLTQ